MKSTYDVLGNHIRLVDKRNRDMITDRVVGINIDKYFMPSVANVIGTDLSKYKLISKGLFACNPMHVGRDERLPVALYTDDEPSLVSPAYFMFEIKDNSILDDEFLMMWFRRKEFDRICWLKTDGSVRGGISWEDICRIEFPLLPISEQKQIVRNYNAISDRIELKRQLNDKLEALIMCHYHILFDDDPMKTECTIGDFGEIISGATPSTAVSEYFCLNGISWLTPKDLTSTGKKFIYKGETDISQDAYDSCSTKLLPKGTVLLTSRAPVGTVALAMNEVCTNQGFKSIVPKKEVGSAFIYCFLKDNKSLLDSHASGTTFMEISGNMLKKAPAFIPSQKRLDSFNAYCNTIFGTQKNNELEIDRLSSLQQMIISGISSR